MSKDGIIHPPTRVVIASLNQPYQMEVVDPASQEERNPVVYSQSAWPGWQIYANLTDFSSLQVKNRLDGAGSTGS